ncbi:unnamed protein product [Litomosoides sigmodontis]|uniref:Uncharacterized protein n=1 Tax=Litomosoides sigmodontis TaxID=42156 RepID=A0A3P6SA57_LITSI|nr:unnamed protein product [Litomosoides sigmodontis]
MIAINKLENLEIGYGPGIVQKLCARFLQLSKERNVVPLVRSPRFKRRKVSAENNFTVMGEIRHCNTQTFASSKPTSKSFVNATKNDVTFFDGQKCELPIVPPVVVDHVELNSRWPCYDDVVIPGDVKGNLKAKKIESIREKFEKISLTSSSLPPHKKFNKVSFRRLAASTELPSRQLDHRDIGKIQRDCINFEIDGDKSTIALGDETIKVVMKLSPPSGDNVTVTKFATASIVSSLSEALFFRKEYFLYHRNILRIEASFTMSSFVTSSARVSLPPIVKMLDGKENGEDGLQEVHRLLKKFDAIREQRAKKCIPEDMSDKTGNRCDRGDYDRLMQLQCQIASPVAIYHSHSSSDSDSHLNPRYNEKKECLKEINLSNRLSGKSELTNAQNFHSGESFVQF